ncbi:MAG TPA: sigma-70 family RNA polymerase sigma factor [Pseudonocardiaceae bacterium]|jgi:RNA polymerase sigma-70 factor (ECF subfamily)|nr:sigma-70 family RNA polymerase sigma factor [Pseudonocardiaceae bacterium]
MTVADDALAREFTAARPQLFGVAYRLTGSVADAEDAVQESWLRLAGANHTDIRDLRAWLVTVVGRICLDRLRSATARRERYVGPWLPEPLVSALPGQPGEDPLDAVTRADEVGLATLVVLDRLTPEQRVAFVLHDAFQLPFAEIADVLGCSADAARQHASRARKAVADAEPPPRLELAEQQVLVGRFMTAMASGDIQAVVALLHPDVVVVGDSGGKARSARRMVSGRDKVARFVVGLIKQYGGEQAWGQARLVLVNGDLGLLLPTTVQAEGHPPLDRRVATFTFRDGLLTALYDVVNPDKLRHIPTD